MTCLVYFADAADGSLRVAVGGGGFFFQKYLLILPAYGNWLTISKTIRVRSVSSSGGAGLRSRRVGKLFLLRRSSSLFQMCMMGLSTKRSKGFRRTRFSLKYESVSLFKSRTQRALINTLFGSNGMNGFPSINGFLGLY